MNSFSESKEVKLTIGLPVHNGEKFIRNALNSILSQDFTDFELIISDNASTDATGRICEDFRRLDKRIIYIRQPQKLPIVDNFLAVLDLANGNYFMWATHDDFYESENYISALYERIKEGFTLVFPNSNMMIANNDGQIAYYKRALFTGFHRPYGSKYEMSKDFIKIYGSYLYGMQFYGMYKTYKLKEYIPFLRKVSKASVFYSEGSFLNKIFSCEKASFVDSVFLNYVSHGENESANIAPSTLLLYYLYYTYFVASIYLSSSFSFYEKVSLFINIAKCNFIKTFWLSTDLVKYYYKNVMKII